MAKSFDLIVWVPWSTCASIMGVSKFPLKLIWMGYLTLRIQYPQYMKTPSTILRRKKTNQQYDGQSMWLETPRRSNRGGWFYSSCLGRPSLSVVEDHTQFLSAPLEVSPALRATQLRTPMANVQLEVLTVYLGITSALLYGLLVWVYKFRK